ncbi:hypothetical protein GYMLUDRAFT_34628 [Collybiopsis luxurians FD-317 M1]|nr:hypothetical protein GYMLUDRAFT_34628 [Collybiopsis luxurians FD-317 M1]
MLPYALKIVWFSLSLAGLISCWAVLSAFALAVRSYRLAMLYCIGCTILQGMFCLGLIWRMDPFLMPRSFCIAQTLLYGFSSYLLTGVCATFSMITSLAILKPGVWDVDATKSISWPASYIFTLIIFPVLAWIPQIAAVLKLDAAQPADSLSCDANKPEWVRFLGYAGTPLVFSIPFSCLAVMAVVRICRTQRQIVQRSRNNNLDPDVDNDSADLTSLPLRRPRRKDIANMLFGPTRKSPTPIATPRALSSPSPSAVLNYPTSPGRAPVSPELSSPSARQFHLPFSPLHPNDDRDRLSTLHSSYYESRGEVESFASSAFPTFAPPSASATPINPRESPGHDFIGYLNRTNPTYHHYESHAPNAQVRRYSPTTGWAWDDNGDYFASAWDESIKWSQDETGNDTRNSNTDVEIESEVARSHGKGGYGFGKEGGDLDVVEEIRTGAEDNSNFHYITRSLRVNSPAMPSPFGSSRKRPFSTSPLAANSPPGTNRPLENIRPAIWRIIIFQLSFTLILILACISTLIDVITHRTRPSPFGTQHVALLLTAWGPVVISGSIPSTWRSIMLRRGALSSSL